jgi:tetratricopeptide (TPR) repeat protein
MRLHPFVAIAITLTAVTMPGTLPAQTPAAGDAATIYRNGSPAVFLVELRSDSNAVVAIGSAFLVAPDLLVTNAHVVQGGRPFLKTGAVALPLSVERLDPAQDLAVLRSAAPLEAVPLRLASGQPAVGSPVFVLGNPQGLERSISEGIISGVRVQGARRLMQLTAAISPGSSGGPVLLKDGTVAGVTVGYLEGGQNLNFAIPAATVRALLAGPTSTGGFAVAVAAVREHMGVSASAVADPAEWRRLTNDLQQALQNAASRATAGPEFLQLAVLADSAVETQLAVQYATEAMRRDRRLADSARAVMMDAWSFSLFVTDSSGKDVLRQMLAVADSQLAHRPRDADALIFRAQALEKLGRGAEAIVAARRAVEFGAGAKLIGWYWTEYHKVVSEFGQASDDDAVFADMVRADHANEFGWAAHAGHLRDRQAWGLAGEAYAKAYRISAQTGSPGGKYACDAGRMWVLGESSDKALDALRTCIEAYSLAARVDTSDVAYAHIAVASILNDRNVFSQAEVSARQARELAPQNPWAALELSRAFEGEQRPTESAAAAAEAIRLSDGRYSSIHFQAGSAYFDLQDWSRCARAYQKAAELAPQDDNAAYNTALCLAKQGYYIDAARWMEQALARNPSRPDRADIQRRIAIWRK